MMPSNINSSAPSTANSKAPASTISSKGQITVPLEIRQRLGLKEGDRVEFVVEDERTIIRPASLPKNPFETYSGALPAFANKREVNAWVRELRDEDGDIAKDRQHK